MAKSDLIEEAKSLGIALTGDETVLDLEALIQDKKGAAPAPTQSEKNASAIADFSWAVNAVKLNRAKAHVQETSSGLKGKDFENAVKARYVELKGLLAEDKPNRSGKNPGRVKNMADHDGTSDDE